MGFEEYPIKGTLFHMNVQLCGNKNVQYVSRFETASIFRKGHEVDNGTTKYPTCATREVIVGDSPPILNVDVNSLLFWNTNMHPYHTFPLSLSHGMVVQKYLY